MQVVSAIWNWIVYALTGLGEIAEAMVDVGILDNGGQGRGTYGR